jgi:hypothetical protein
MKRKLKKKKKRNYKREYALYHGKPKQIKRRAQRNKTRRMMARQGLVKKGDGKDIDHINHNVYDQRRSNLRILPKSINRSIK